MGKVRKHIRLNSLSGEETSFAYVEAFKTLRTNLEFLSSETDCKKIVVTSPLAEEGDVYKRQILPCGKCGTKAAEPETMHGLAVQ